MKTTILFLLGCVSLLAAASERPTLVIVLVIDGLRPDSITPSTMPNLVQLQTAGVWYAHSHSVFPTVTRVNTASISTGTLPSRHGIASNSVYLPAISRDVLSNGDYRNLLSLGKENGGRVVGPKSLHEYLQAASMEFVAISSGSTGNALLLNPTAPYGNGQLINGGFENGSRVAFPDSLNAALLAEFGAVKGSEDGDQALLWTEKVLREYVLKTMHPQVIVDWMGRSDSAQHKYGVGSPEALSALRLIDEQIGLLLRQLRQMNLEDKTDIIVTCDHGFDYEPKADLLAPLRDSGLDADEVAVDNEGGATLLYVKDHDAGKISRLVAKFQASGTTNAIFVAATRPTRGRFRCSPRAVKGYEKGTFALDLAAQCLPMRGPDMIVTHRWTEEPNPFGVAGMQWVPGTPGQAPGNGHGGLNPFVTHSTLLAVGPDFARGKVVELPAGNQDIAPTVLALEGLTPPSLDGRVLSEAFRNSARKSVGASSRRFKVTTDGFCTEIEVSYAGSRRYLNWAGRCGRL